MITLEELNKWNEDQEREDTLYYISLRKFSKSRYGYKETSGDDVMFMSNDLDEIKSMFDDYKYRLDLERIPYTLEIMQAFEVYNNNLDYSPIAEYSNMNKGASRSC